MLYYNNDVSRVTLYENAVNKAYYTTILYYTILCSVQCVFYLLQLLQKHFSSNGGDAELQCAARLQVGRRQVYYLLMTVI